MKNIEVLQDMIRTKSYSGEEEQVLDVIQAHFLDQGIESFRQSPLITPETSQVANLLVHLEGKDRNKALIFNGHVDTVATSEEKWNPHKPFGKEAGVISDEKVYGLGASDMKGSDYTMMMIADYFHGSGAPPYDLWFSFVVEEETTGRGSEAFVEWFLQNKYPYKEMGVIVAEPTGLDNLHIGMRGCYEFLAEVKGSSGHAARVPIDAVNGINRMVHFLSDVISESNNWKKQFYDEDFGPPSITPTVLSAGDINSPNVLSSQCQAVIDVRSNPAFDEVAFELLQEKGNMHGINLSTLWSPAPALVADKNSRLINIVSEVSNSRPSIMSATCDVGWFINNGFDQAVVHGPGDKNVIHKPNEYIDISDMEEMYRRYLSIIEKW